MLGYQVCVRLSGVCWVIIKCVYVCVGVGFVLGLSYVSGLSYVLGYRDVCVDLGCQV